MWGLITGRRGRRQAAPGGFLAENCNALRGLTFPARG